MHRIAGQVREPQPGERLLLAAPSRFDALATRSRWAWICYGWTISKLRPVVNSDLGPGAVPIILSSAVHHNQSFARLIFFQTQSLLDKQIAIGIKGALRVGPVLRLRESTWQVARRRVYNLTEKFLLPKVQPQPRKGCLQDRKIGRYSRKRSLP